MASHLHDVIIIRRTLRATAEQCYYTTLLSYNLGKADKTTYELNSPAELFTEVSRLMRVRHMSYRTEQCYLHWLRRFVAFHGRRNPAHLDEAAVCAFLSHLAVQEKVAASTQNQAFHALLFFYREVLGQKELHWRNVQRAPRSKRLTVVLTREEVRSVLLHMEGQSVAALAVR